MQFNLLITMYSTTFAPYAYQVSLGAEMSVAAGPIGRVANGAVTANLDMNIAPILSYSHSRGLFAGISLEGAVIASRPDVNRAFYGHDVTAKQLLSNEIAPPPAAKPLYDALAEIKLF
jgi:SH3 domain-containing YSC84-like protein 1